MVLFPNFNAENAAWDAPKYETGFEPTPDASSSSTCQCKSQPCTKNSFQNPNTVDMRHLEVRSYLSVYTQPCVYSK